MIDVIMSTYNGERFIREQIDSILAQDIGNINLIIRDDCSEDSTVSIIYEYMKKNNNIRMIDNENKNYGSSKSFMKLMSHSSAEYIMFADQDDYWHSKKASILLKTMRECEEQYGNIPILVYSAYTPVDENLKEIPSYNEKKNIISKHYCELNRLLIQNYITGCTMMINKELCRISTINYDSRILMHDWWIALCASAMGVIKYTNQSTMLYRQHLNQSVGAINIKTPSYFLNKLKDPQTKTNDRKCVEQAKLLQEQYHDRMSQETNLVIGEFAEIYNRNKWERINTLLKGKYLKSSFLRAVSQLFFV